MGDFFIPPKIHIVVGFLTDMNLEDPGSFNCNGLNTLIFHHRVPQDFNHTIEQANEWYLEHVFDGGKSPEFDEEKDKIYLDIIRQRLESAKN